MELRSRTDGRSGPGLEGQGGRRPLAGGEIDPRLGGTGGGGPPLSRRSLIAIFACALLLPASAHGLSQGTIYYRTAGGLRAMNADGSSDRLVFDSSMSVSPRDQKTHGSALTCSLRTDNGAPHWLAVLDDDPTNATGDPGQYFTYGTLYRVTADATGAATLTQLSDFDYANRGFALAFGGVRWAADDTFISFLMVDYRTGPTPLLKLVQFPVARLGIVPVDETTVTTVLSVPVPHLGDDQYFQHTWSPDGTLLAYRNLYDFNGTTYSQLVLRRVATGDEQVLVGQQFSGLDVGGIQYAPDGTRIAFASNRTVYTISANGGAPRAIAATSTARNGTSTSYDGPNWSPDSAGLAIHMWTRDRFNVFDYYIARVASTGGAVTNLTPRTSDSKAPVAWR